MKKVPAKKYKEVKAKQKAREETKPPPKKTSGDTIFDLAINKLLKKK